jgi:hypothetical protein
MSPPDWFVRAGMACTRCICRPTIWFFCFSAGPVDTGGCYIPCNRITLNLRINQGPKIFPVAPAPSLSPRPWQDRLYSIYEMVIRARTQLLQGRNEKWSGNFTEAAGSACGGGTSLMFLAHTWKENKKEGSPPTLRSITIIADICTVQHVPPPPMDDMGWMIPPVENWENRRTGNFHRLPDGRKGPNRKQEKKE